MYLLVSIFSLKKETSCRETNFSNSKKNLSPSAIVVLTSAATLVISIVVLFSFLFSWVFCVPNKNLIKSNKKSNHTSIYVNQFINLYANCFKEKKITTFIYYTVVQHNYKKIIQIYIHLYL